MERRMKEKELDVEVGGVVQRTQRDSKVGKVGIRILETLREERYSKARPPPLPVSLGELIIEKLGGRRLRSRDG
jgi:hypothetical protein